MTPLPKTMPAALPAEEDAPRQVGDYDLLGEIARGGMGVVFKAPAQPGLDRP